MRDFAIALAICLLLALVAAAWMKVKIWRLIRSRGKPNMPKFVEYFRSQGISPEVATAVYQYLANLRWMRNLPIEPKDRLDDVCRIGVEELSDAYSNILVSIGRYLPEGRKRDAFLIETVEDMVRFIADLPLKGSA